MNPRPLEGKCESLFEHCLRLLCPLFIPQAKAETVQKLLSLGATPDPRNKQSLTPLIMAAARGGGSAVVHLVQAGADAGLVLSGGATVLHICADMGLREVIRRGGGQGPYRGAGTTENASPESMTQP